MSRELSGRIALVTGGGTGIGAAITAYLADAGATVVLAQLSQTEADQAVDRLRRSGREITGVGGDLRTARACADVVNHVIDRLGRIDILVNNAAVTGPPAVGPFLDFADEQLDSIIDTNLKAVFRCSRLAARDMLLRRKGVIINVASVAAFAAQPDAAAYVASKAGVVGLTKGMAFELAPLGIRVVAVAPGYIETDASMLLENARQASSQGTDTPAQKTLWQRDSPLGIRGTPEDIAAAVRFLSTDDARFITGETLVIDGGMLSY